MRKLNAAPAALKFEGDGIYKYVAPTALKNYEAIAPSRGW